MGIDKIDLKILFLKLLLQISNYTYEDIEYIKKMYLYKNKKILELKYFKNMEKYKWPLCCTVGVKIVYHVFE